MVVGDPYLRFVSLSPPSSRFMLGCPSLIVSQNLRSLEPGTTGNFSRLLGTGRRNSTSTYKEV